MNNTVSVIIPTYNRRYLIGATIDNILQQTLLPFEIIVVDDHSNDGTLDWLKAQYGDRLILLSNKGKGPGAARNTGLKIATGDYIKFFDSDDLMTKNTLEVQVKKLKETGKGFATGPYIYASEVNGNWVAKDNLILNYSNFHQNKPLRHWMIWGLFIPIPGMLFTREFLNKAGFWPEEMITSEDWAYLWRMAMIEPFPAHTNECAFIYRLHREQSTGANLNNTERDREKYQVLKQIYERDIMNGSFSTFEKLLFRNKFYQIARITQDVSLKEELYRTAGKKATQILIWEYFRINQKIGRVQTRTDWQPFHGSIGSSMLFNNYMENILTTDAKK
jgi:hypothetical protein